MQLADNCAASKSKKKKQLLFKSRVKGHPDIRDALFCMLELLSANNNVLTQIKSAERK
ncbi:hypothetical protein NCCP2050_14760 [Planococcus sp. NCCP-2050]|nr:hypothetical protein NCCP2050_14760 [Planococcus sp. NCCP-2050]